MPTPTEEQLNARIAASGQTPYTPAPVGAPKPISATAVINPPQPLNVTAPTLSPVTPISQVTQPQATPATKTETPASGFITDLDKLTGQYGNKVATTQAETALATAPFEQQLNQVNTDLATLQANAIARQEQVRQSGGDVSFQAGESQRVARNDAIEEMRLLARQAGLQGNIALAEKRAKAAVDLKYEQTEAQIKAAKSNIYNNWDTFTKDEQKRAKNALLQLDRDDVFIAEKKAEETQITNMATTALSNGATAAQAAKIMDAETFDEALKLGGTFLGAEFRLKQEQAAFDRGIKTRQMQIQEQEFALKRKALLIDAAKAGDASAIKQLGYDPNNLPRTPAQIASLEAQKLTMQRDIDIVNRAKTNGVGLQTSSGLIRGGFLGAFFESPGGILGSTYGAAKKNDFLADAGYIVKNLTFDKIKELSDKGIKLTPISEKELKAMGDASNVLVSAAIFDDSGRLTGFKMSESRVREHLQLIADHYTAAKDDLTANLVLTEAERREINSL